MKALGWAVAVIGAGFAVMLAGCGGGEDGPDVDSLIPPEITGTWRGTFTDTRGTGTLVVVIADQGRNVMPAFVSGTLNMSYANGTQNGGPLGDGSTLGRNSSDQYFVSLLVTFSTPGHGANLFQGVFEPGMTTLSGTFGGDWSQGTFELAKE